MYGEEESSVESTMDRFNSCRRRRELAWRLVVKYLRARLEVSGLSRMLKWTRENKWRRTVYRATRVGRVACASLAPYSAYPYSLSPRSSSTNHRSFRQAEILHCNSLFETPIWVCTSIFHCARMHSAFISCASSRTVVSSLEIIVVKREEYYKNRFTRISRVSFIRRSGRRATSSRRYN